MLILGQKLKCQTGFYLKRWVLDFKLFSVRLHHWYTSDDQRHFHDHPWNYLTIILKGGYTDISPEGNREMTVGSLARFKAEHQHTAKVNPGGCWSLLFTGPVKREWGFWIKGKFKKRNKYHFIKGLHPCK